MRIKLMILSQTEYEFLFMKFQVIKELVITDNKSRCLSLDHDYMSSEVNKINFSFQISNS